MPDPVALDRRLAADPCRYAFYQAMRQIECAYPAKPRIGASARAADDPVRFGQDADMAFVPSELSAYRPATAQAPARLAVNALGLMGTTGPLPLHLTEYVRDRARHAGDTTLAGFLDMFHHRMMSLFYRAWAVGQPVIGHDRADGNHYAKYVGSLCGLGSPATHRTDGIGEYAKLQFSGLLAARTRHAHGLASLLSRYFRVPAAINQFVGQWLYLSGEDRARLGRGGAKRLGHGLPLGARVWDRQHKFRVVLGPLDKARAQGLQPGTDGFRRLAEWVRLYAGSILDWDVELRLAPGAAAAMRLDGNARLSRSTWLGRPGGTAGAPCLRFQSRDSLERR
ncbi:type VI secretion protein [Bordetella sp. H567]|uniref:type VI secretion system baseplate subunit TssG n=1 Tax=Bordetella sp. H567 TaxID=1697043 RepID=UPI00081C48AD|nr:type VI secretion system baseplate subunit TssG [Bordetella sp. H567]AOB32509.1 type VI secretion protein [Bordetella sp. H567]